MSNLAAPLYITGLNIRTGKFLLGGIYRMHDQIGFPIDCSIDECRERGYEIDWIEAMCDCWLNDCLKFDSFLRQVKSQCPNIPLLEMFQQAGATILAMYPKMLSFKNPVDAACKYILRKKQLGKFQK